MELNFRLAQREDVKELVSVCNFCFDEDTDYQQALQVFDDTYTDKNQLYLIGLIDGKIVAHTKITIVPTIFKGMDTYAILNHVCVLPDYRRHHIASHMMEVTVNICKERGCKSIKLWSKNFREAAHKHYLHEGFEIIDAKFFELNIEE